MLFILQPLRQEHTYDIQNTHHISECGETGDLAKVIGVLICPIVIRTQCKHFVNINTEFYLPRYKINRRTLVF